MISNKIQKALNSQINAEMYSSYLYLGMSAYFEENKLHGCAQWMKVQAREELVHAMKIYDFIHAREGKVELKAIDTPPKKWKSAFDAFKDAYEHEQAVTMMIYKIVDLANEEKDHAVSTFLQWFITEQVEEESNASHLLDKFSLVKDAPSGLFMLDQDLGNRKVTSNESA